jgi:putative transposase
MVNYLVGRYTVGLRQACRCVRMTRSMYYYRSRMDPQTALRHRMREIAHARVRFGYRRIYIMLRREGWDVGKDRFYRVYREENLPRLGFLQERGLVLGRVSVEYCVTMRKAAESIDDRLVRDCITRPLLVA